MLTLVAQNLMNVTNTAFLGHFSEVALGASAIAGVFYFAIFIIGLGFGQGVQILIGRRNGEQNYAAIGDIINNALIFNLLLALIIFIASIFGIPHLMKLLVSSPNIYAASIEYLDYRIYGYFFIFLNVIFRSFFVGITKTKVLTVSAAIMATVNILLDYCLIFGNWGMPEMGIKGAALASVIAEAIATIFMIAYTYTQVDTKKYNLISRIKVNFKIIEQILKISIFIMFQYFISIFTWFMFFVFIEKMGERPLAITNIGRSIYSLLMIPASALSITAATLVSNLIGAGESAKVMPAVMKISRIAIIATLPLILFTALFPQIYAQIYTSDTSLILAAIPTVRVVSIALILYAVGNVIINAVSGTGSTRMAFVIELISLIFYILYVYYFSIYNPHDVSIVWLSELVYWSIMGVLAYVFMKQGKWKQKVI